MQSEIDSLKQRISELEAEKAELEAKNAELLKQVMEESTKRKAENVELKARIAKLEQKQTQAITNKQEPSSTKDISLLIKSHSDEEKGITPNPLPEIEHISTQAQRGESLDSSESSTEPETSTTSLPQDIINDDSAEILDFVETIHKERISSEIRERNREKKLQESHNNLTPPIQSETSTMSTPKSLDLKPVKELWDQNQNKNQNKSHKKKGTENITQVIADDNLLDSNHVTEISATALHQNSSVLLFDLAQLFDKATDAEYSAIKANQEETLCWTNYEKEFIIQYNDLVKNSNGKIGEKKAKGIIYDKILEHLNIIRERRSKEMGLQLPEISRKTLCKKTQKAVRTYKLFDKIGIDKIKYLKAYSTNSISELTNEQIQKIIDNISNHESNIGNHMTEISTTARHQNHTTEIVSTLPETKVSAFSEKLSPKKSSETISEESTEASASSNPTHDHAYFCNKILWRYSDLYKEFSSEKFDYYRIHEGSLCLVCKHSHEKGKSLLFWDMHRVSALLTPEYLDWHANLVDLPSSQTDKIHLSLYRAYTEETGLDPWIKSETSESPQIKKDAEKKTLFVPQINVQPTPSKLRSSISVLPKDLEERQQHVIEMVLERFPYLTLKHSFKYSNYFDFNRSVLCPICNNDHKKENIRNFIEDEWESGEYCGKKTYRLYCYKNKYQNSIQIVTVKA
ncbi:7435_t:CDS:2 [Cetraspora pellucida]|uniref:7435_t:CDS:1 n=2 Tax=Gigasporaceae TaxID=36753 RepID=A0A9N9ETK2_9GLOM|nr:7435_t:CDS:2 [Cetraspora pellucida]